MRDIEAIYQEMMQVFPQRAGYLPADACDLPVRLYAMAAQVQALYAQADWVMAQSFPQTASGVYLDYHGEVRGIVRSAATAAKGAVRFFVSAPVGQDLAIPAGTVCMTAGGLRFATQEAAVLPAGKSHVDVSAQAMETGAAGNIGPGVITVMAVPPAGITRCGNPEPFAGGAEEESDASLRERILNSYRRLPNGANAAFYEQEAMGFPAVAAATAVGRARGIGTVDVYVATVAGAPEAPLLAEIQAYLQEKREIAVDLQVKAPKLRPVALQAALKPAKGYTHEEAAAAADTALRGYFTGRLLGQGVLRAELGNLLYQLPSVANYQIITPAADVPAAVGELPTLQSLTIGEV